MDRFTLAWFPLIVLAHLSKLPANARGLRPNTCHIRRDTFLVRYWGTPVLDAARPARLGLPAAAPSDAR
jgi:hypothetical protein